MPKINWRMTGGIAAIGAAALIWTQMTAQTGASSGAALVAVTMPELTGDAVVGAERFGALCASCHGVNADGVDGAGPPLVHKIYEPSHHGDAAFELAAMQGVRRHHWRFGDMPPVAGVTADDIRTILAFVRTVQRANGIE